RPAVDIDRSAAARCRMKGGIDIVGTALEALHAEPAVAKRARQRQRQRGLAGAGGRRRDNKAARHLAGLRETRARADRPVAAVVVSGIESALLEIPRCERTTDQDDRGALEFGTERRLQRPERGANNSLIGPAGAPDHG